MRTHLRTRVKDRIGTIPRPELVGAILLKARAVEVDDAPTSQRSDLALLLSLVDEPDQARAVITPTERRWLRRRSEMDDLDAECWRSLPPDDAQRGLSAFRALTSLK